MIESCGWVLEIGKTGGKSLSWQQSAESSPGQGKNKGKLPGRCRKLRDLWKVGGRLRRAARKM